MNYDIFLEVSKERDEMMNAKKIITKGSIIWVDGIWYVVVEQKGDDYHCICDHANNIHSYTLDDIDQHYTPYTAMTRHGWGHDYNLSDLENSVFEQLVVRRDIPVETIAEVLAGCHDDRFTHWSKE